MTQNQITELCNICNEQDCCVSMDGTCAFMRKQVNNSPETLQQKISRRNYYYTAPIPSYIYCAWCNTQFWKQSEEDSFCSLDCRNKFRIMIQKDPTEREQVPLHPLVQWRRANGYTRKVFCELFRFNHQTIAEFEWGLRKQLHHITLEKLSMILQKSPEQIMHEYHEWETSFPEEDMLMKDGLTLTEEERYVRKK